MKPKIGLIDYGAGNFSSVWNALSFLELDTVRVTTPQELTSASHLILPGVGAFAVAMRKLEKLNLVDEIRNQICKKKKPFLGICVGMQLLASLGTEFEEYAGIGAIPGTVQKMSTMDEKLILPHMGWNTVIPTRTSLLFHGMTPSPIFYFVHSYHFIPTSPQAVLAQCNYGSDFVAAIQHENIFGVQFHPEKSQHHGLLLLKNFATVEAAKSA